MPTFDGEALTITLDSGVTDVDVLADLYKDWKDWMLAGNMRYPQAFVSDGGNPLSGVINQGSYIFLQNQHGWRIKPPEEDITIYFTGNLAVNDTTLPAFVATDGAFTAAILGLQPVTQGVTDALVDNVTLGSFNSGIYWDNVSGKAAITDTTTDGNEANPLLNMADVISQAVLLGFNKIHVVSDATVPSTPSVDGYSFDGRSRASTVVTFGDGVRADTGDCVFENMHMTGVLWGGINVKHCIIDSLTGVGCTVNETILDETLFEGNIELRPDNTQSVVIINCGSINSNQMVLDVNGTTGNIVIQNYSDRLKIINMTSAIDLHISSAAGCELTIDVSCTAVGSLEIHGQVNIINESALTIDDDTTQKLVWEVPRLGLTDETTIGGHLNVSGKILKNKTITDPVTGVMTVFDDDGITVLFTANIWENVAGTDPYVGNGVDRREALG